MADRNDILVTDMPGGLVFVHRVDEVDMGRRQPGRMGPGKGPVFKPVHLLKGLQGGGSGAVMDGDGDQPPQDLQAEPVLRLVLVEDDQRQGGQRTSVDGGDEQGGGRCGDSRSLAVGAGPESGPQSGIDQTFTDGRRLELVRPVHGLTEGNRFVAVQFDHQRLEFPFLPPVDGSDRPAPRRGKDHPRISLVGEQGLADNDALARSRQHGRFHADIIVADNCHLADRIARPDLLLRSPGDGDVKALFYLDCLHISLLV
ncbi:MAG: hypothetical protein ACD_75C00634G0001 [uncultured bacterium]|nr:MAG: hypothetical protein ACD_75C00634G0001 [uncultured bacterium]